MTASLVIATAAAAGLTLSGPAPQASATTITQAGPFGVGNLLNYANSDIESTNFSWAADLNQTNNVASIGQGTGSVLHAHSLKIVASGTGTVIYKLGNGQDNTAAAITLPKTAGDYRVGAYMKVPASTGHTVEFDLGCFDSTGQWLGWATGTPVSMNSNGTWQYVEEDFLAGTPSALPSGCSQVQGSPRVKVTGMTANGIVHMDDVIFAPYRAALAIGAHGQICEGCSYTAADWSNTDKAIGPLQSDKEFNGGDLPATFSGTNCAGDETELANRGLGSSRWPVCIITYKTPVASQAAMDTFLQGVPAQQEIILVWHQEPEGDTFPNNLPGCTGDTGATAFKCETEQQAGLVHSSPYDTPNVFIAQNSAGFPYLSDPAVTNCSWITPPSATGQGVDLYLMDHYENGTVNGKDVNNSTNAAEWQNWLKCASAQNRPLGFGEYGLDNSPIGPASLCTNGPTSPPNAENLPKALAADNGYLAQLPMSADPNLLNPAPFVVWDYWYSNYGGTPVCTVFDNTYGAIDKWKSIETQNGGN